MISQDDLNRVIDALAFNPAPRAHPWRRLVFDGLMIAAVLGFFIFVVGRHWQ